MWFTAVAGLLLGAAAVVADSLPTISAVGNKFFDKNGKQFFLKGIAYQLVPDDPLVDTNQCALDAALMQTLGTNSIRVYHVDPSADHSGCMGVFAKAGIYVLVDLDTFSSYILPETPYWNQTQYNKYTQVVDAFQQYDNTLGFFIGNEIITLKNQSMVTPFIKAATRDIKAYIKNKGYRSIPVGYSAADIAELRPMLQDYLTCGGNTSENIDFFSLNSYEWCGVTNYQDSGYANLQNMSVNYPVPIFFSETGCIKPAPRLFADQAAIFGPEMVDTWSGAIIYEWIQETNEYGLISYAAPLAPTATGSNIADGFLRKGTPTPILPDFTNLKSQWATLTPTGIAQSAYNAQQSVSTRPCPMSTPGGWLVNGNVALPSLGETLTGSYSSVPTVDPNTAGASSAKPSSTSSKDAASANRELAGMSAGLASVFIFFTLWL